MEKYLKFWGTRGSCPVSGSQYAEFGGNTSCLELRYQDQLLIFDAGSGIRPLGHTLSSQKEIHIFLSHTHWDHWSGFPFFAPIHQKDVRITLWAPGSSDSLKKRFETLFSSDFFPIPLHKIPAEITFKSIEQDHPLQIGPLTLNFHPTLHPSPTLCFKIQTPHQIISYVTDNEANATKQDAFIHFHKNADLFIHETQYTKEEYTIKTGWGHSSLSSVVELIEKIQPKSWYVTHHDPQHTDQDLRNLAHSARALLKQRNLHCPVRFLFDGFTHQLK